MKIYDAARAAPPPSVNAAATMMLVATLSAIGIAALAYRRFTRGERQEGGGAKDFVSFQV